MDSVEGERLDPTQAHAKAGHIVGEGGIDEEEEALGGGGD